MRISPLLTFALLPTLFGCEEIIIDPPGKGDDNFEWDSAGTCSDIGTTTDAFSVAPGAPTCECSTTDLMDGVYSQVYIEYGDQDIEPAYIGYDIAGALSGTLRNPTPGAGWARTWVAYHRPNGSSPNFSTDTDLSGDWVLYFTQEDHSGTSHGCSDYNPGWYTTQDPALATGREARSGDVDRVARFLFHPDRFGGDELRQGGFAAKAGSGDLDGMYVDHIEILQGPWDRVVYIDGVEHSLEPGTIIEGSDIGNTLTGVWAASANFEARIVGTNEGREAEEPSGVWSYDLDEAMSLQLAVAQIPDTQGVLEWHQSSSLAKIIVPGSGLNIGIPVEEDGSFSVLRGQLAGTITEVSATQLTVDLTAPPLGTFTYSRETVR